jgi:sugar phosphate isomerase/epimerase
MSHRLSRRQALASGSAAAGMFFGLSGTRDAGAWPPGPDDNKIVRDLKPGTTPIRLASYIGYASKDISPEYFKKLRDNGFTAVVSSPAPFDTMKDAELSDLRAILKKFDVVVFEVGGYTNMIHPDMATRQKNLKQLAVCIETADKMNCPMVGTISGSLDPVNFFNVTPDNWTEKTWKMLVASMKQVLKDTSGMKAAIGMEAQVTTNIDGPKAHKRLMEDVGDKRCAVNLDPVNMVSLATYYHTTELLNECFDLLGENILGCHAKDTYIIPDQQTVHVQEVCSGRGVMDYETYLVRLSRMKWPRALLPEHIPSDQMSEAYAYIRKVAARVGVKFYG